MGTDFVDDNRDNKEAQSRATKRQDVNNAVDGEIDLVAPPLQQVFLLTEILKELRIIRENL